MKPVYLLKIKFLRAHLASLSVEDYQDFQTIVDKYIKDNRLDDKDYKMIDLLYEKTRDNGDNQQDNQIA